MNRKVVFAADIGTGVHGSGWVVVESSATSRDLVCAGNTTVLDCGVSPNVDVLDELSACQECIGEYELALEMIQSYGNAQGKTIHHTLLWMGRMIERYQSLIDHQHLEPALVLRATSRAWLTDSRKANDSAVMHAVIDRFGADRRTVVGRKKSPGPLYGFKSHIWQAMAVAIAYVEGCKVEPYLG